MSHPKSAQSQAWLTRQRGSIERSTHDKAALRNFKALLLSLVDLIDISDREVARRLPDAEAKDVPEGNGPHKRVYNRALPSPLCHWQHVELREGKVHTVLCSSGLPLGEHQVEDILRFGKTGVEMMKQVWGPPTVAGISSGAGLDEIVLRWDKPTARIEATMTSPARILEDAGQLNAPIGSFMLILQSPAHEPVASGKDPAALGELTDAAFDAKYSDYEQRMRTNITPSSARLIPDAAKGVYIGMPVRELKKVRPGVQLGNWFDGPNDYFEDGLPYVGYELRQDRVIFVQVHADPEEGDKLVQWVAKRWGVADSLWLHGRGKLFEWDHGSVRSRLAISESSKIITVYDANVEMPNDGGVKSENAALAWRAVTGK